MRVVYDDKLNADDGQRAQLEAFERALTSHHSNEAKIELCSGITVGSAGEVYEVTLDRPDTAVFWVTGGKLSRSQLQVKADLPLLFVLNANQTRTSLLYVFAENCSCVKHGRLWGRGSRGNFKMMTSYATPLRNSLKSPLDPPFP